MCIAARKVDRTIQFNQKETELKPEEQDKIKFARKHFEAISTILISLDQRKMLVS